jgi:cellulose synthase/poly-beta-1,6-N-acetylglucosamine synthase-like glycosyltransferase
MSAYNLTVELVIPSYNRLNTLRETIRQIRQLYPDLNICLGLQCEMPSGEFQAQVESDSKLRIEKLSLPSTTETLNHCISSSKADIVLMLDDDATPCFNWLESHIRAFMDKKDLAYTCGREIRLTKERSALSEWFRIMVEWFFGLFVGRDRKLNGRIVGWINRLGVIFGNYDQPGTCVINSPRGCNMAVRRELFLKIGGFNNKFIGNAWGFEADFGLRWAREGRYGRYVGDAIVIHQEVPMGGTRQASKAKWIRDYIYNNKLLIKNIGPQAWLGSVPRLVKNTLWRRIVKLFL